MLDVTQKIPADEVPFGEEAVFLIVEPVTPEHDPVPPGLDAMEPGPVLAGWLASIDVATVSPFDGITVLKAHDRMASHYQAQRYRDMAVVSDAEAELWGADVEMGFALEMYRRLPRLAGMLESGIIDLVRAKVIEAAIAHLPDAVAREVLDAVADDAPELTTGQLRARIRRLCIDTGPDDARDRYDTAVTDARSSLRRPLQAPRTCWAWIFRLSGLQRSPVVSIRLRRVCVATARHGRWISYVPTSTSTLSPVTPILPHARVWSTSLSTSKRSWGSPIIRASWVGTVR